MSKVVETNVPIAARALNAGRFQCLVEGVTQCGNRIPASAWARKERLLGKAGSEVLGCQRPAAQHLLKQIRSNRNHS